MSKVVFDPSCARYWLQSPDSNGEAELSSGIDELKLVWFSNGKLTNGVVPTAGRAKQL
jgi:hypothetical protein